MAIIQNRIINYCWEIFSQIFPQLERQFQEEAPYRGKKHLENVKQHAALYCLDEKKQSPWRDINKRKYRAKLFGKKATIFRGYVRHRQRHHAEKDLLARFKTTGQGSTFIPSKLPKGSIMLFYTTYSPCGKCMPELAEFVNHCKTSSHFALFFERYYQEDTKMVEHFLNIVPHEQRAIETMEVCDKQVTMVLIRKYERRKKKKRKYHCNKRKKCRKRSKKYMKKKMKKIKKLKKKGRARLYSIV